MLNEERRLRQEREIGERKFRSIFEHAATGIFLLDHQGALMSCNPAFREILMTLDARARSPGTGIPALFDNDAKHVRDMIEACQRENRSIQRDVKVRSHDGKSDRWLHLTLTKIEDVVFQGVVNDITDRKEAEASALETAMTDSLTGILNRLGFETRLTEKFQRGYRSSDTTLALLLIDLDRFKQVNDTHGHDAGDLVLIGVANLLKRLIRKTDLVGRLGGDEFVVLLSSVASIEALESIAQKIVEGVARPFDLGGGRVANIGASIGIAISRYASSNQEQLFKQADEAMYQAKKAGRDTYRFYDRSLRPASVQEP